MKQQMNATIFGLGVQKTQGQGGTSIHVVLYYSGWLLKAVAPGEIHDFKGETKHVSPICLKEFKSISQNSEC